ncbi:helix-turn-helix domain-containing protein [Methylobacterium soli]|uniref:Helix-turn-helix transcriptional regulator n=1 Tax=Methylobacterium soli TaxID=553447 RepID=A0A6L3STJ3_9HYPH|nr:helix-turn-helix transcriptional regulator [Methylobacterium soli]KAB1072384.1 helix-turn-helix transcriptional regulator [Methylobacterium soli]
MSKHKISLTPRLVRAARALTGWQQQELADASGVPKPTISAFELKSEDGRMISANARLIIDAFERAGLEFIPENGGGAGIRFRVKRDAKAGS